MKRIAFVLLLVLGGTAASTLAADTFVVGVEQSTKDSWQSLASSFQTATGIAVSIQPLSQSAIGQQVTLQAFTRSGRLHFVMIAESWGSTIAR
jgi:ABC-type molybdate transport system substrate-binding protein